MRKTLEQRLYEKLFHTVSGCAEFQGARDRDGYGKIRKEGRVVFAHRVAWELIHGPIPAGKQVLHKYARRTDQLERKITAQRLEISSLIAVLLSLRKTNAELVKLVQYCLWVEDWDADWVSGELERLVPESALLDEGEKHEWGSEKSNTI